MEEGTDDDDDDDDRQSLSEPGSRREAAVWGAVEQETWMTLVGATVRKL